MFCSVTLCGYSAFLVEIIHCTKKKLLILVCFKVGDGFLSPVKKVPSVGAFTGSDNSHDAAPVIQSNQFIKTSNQFEVNFLSWKVVSVYK